MDTGLHRRQRSLGLDHATIGHHVSRQRSMPNPAALQVKSPVECLVRPQPLSTLLEDTPFWPRDEAVEVHADAMKEFKNLPRRTDDDFFQSEAFQEVTSAPTRKIYLDKIRRVEVMQNVEQIRMIPKYIEVEKIVEVPVIEYREVNNFREVEVPEIVEQVIIREIPIPQYVEVEVPDVHVEELEVEIKRQIPAGMEHITHVPFHVPSIRVEYEEVPYPIYAPMFVQVAVPVEQMRDTEKQKSETLRAEIEKVTSADFPSLRSIEEVGKAVGEFHPNLLESNQILRTQWQNSCSDGFLRTRCRAPAIDSPTLSYSSAYCDELSAINPQND